MTRSRDEIEEAIDAFTPADWARLNLVAKAYARGRPIDWQDLIQEAHLRALDGQRKCPEHVDVVKFLCESMRSIANAEAQRVEHRMAHVPVTHTGDPNDQTLHLADEAGDRETQKLDEEKLEEHASVCARIIALFDEDPAARLILKEIMEGSAGEELRKLTGLDKTAYESKRKFMRRTIDRHFPNGWKP